MVWVLLGAHALAAAAAGLVGRRLGRWVFALIGAPLLATAGWSIGRLGADDVVEVEASWVPELDLGLVFRVDAFSTLLAVLVSGIGVGVASYAGGYFGPTANATGRFAAALVAFAGAMLGLVWADSVWTLFVFWELTSITSFLLVGHKTTDSIARTAARRALLITAAGGLALLAGSVVLVDLTGTPRLSEMGPVEGTRAAVAAALVFVGVATKSAQVPFHVWLPGAMAAPTPVSAYLHSATMVKAGVILTALMGPILGDVELWRTLGLVVGLATMVWGGVGALRQIDGKLILAWGTVSQLGFLVALFAAGSAKATFAGVAMLVAHAVFKAALFLAIGIVDVRTGTRRIDQLANLHRVMPLVAAVFVVAGLSMAGVPPLLGFVTKEAAVEAALGLDGWQGTVLLLGVIVGSVLTVAYTARLLLGLLGPGETPEVKPARLAMDLPAAVIGAGSLLGFVLLGPVDGWVHDAAIVLDAEAEVYHLARWHGLNTALGISAGIVATGAVLGWAVWRRPFDIPRSLGAEMVDAGVDGILTGAKLLTARIQHGSLPWYLVTMTTVAVVALIPVWWGLGTEHLVFADSGMQAVLALLVAVSALLAVLPSSRLGAAVSLGLVGVGVTGIFVAHGAPDLALTQLLVETVIVVGFVFGLGRLTTAFPVTGIGWRSTRLVVALAAAGAVGAALVAAGRRPSGEPPTAELVAGAVDEGGGRNTVNVILTDVRALDTLGEVVVLAVVAVGVLALTRSAGVVEEDAA